MVYRTRLTVGGRGRATCSSTAGRRVVTAGLICGITVWRIIWTVSAVMHCTDAKLVEENYCQQNKFKKEAISLEDILDDTTSICSSSIVLDYTIQELKQPLRGAYLAQAVAGAISAAAGAPALAGLLLGRRRLLLVWSVTKAIWCLAVAGSAAALSPFGFPTFVPMLAGEAAASLLFGGLVLWCGWKKSDRQKRLVGLERHQAGMELEELGRKLGEEGNDADDST